MKRRAFLAAVAALVLGLAPAAEAHTWWSVDDTCNVRGDDYFYPGGPAQWWRIHSNSDQTFGRCHLYTRNAETATYNYADWYLPTRTCDGGMRAVGGHNDGRCINERLYTGTYQVLAWIARESHFTTRRAPYIRYAYSLSRGQSQLVRLDQSTGVSGNRLVLTGYFDTRVDYGYSGFMRVTDFTGEPSQSKFVGVDRLYYHSGH